jgi:hypothetical protein
MSNEKPEFIEHSWPFSYARECDWTLEDVDSEPYLPATTVSNSSVHTPEYLFARVDLALECTSASPSRTQQRVSMSDPAASVKSASCGDNANYLHDELQSRVQNEPELFDWIQSAALDGLW